MLLIRYRLLPNNKKETTITNTTTNKETKTHNKEEYINKTHNTSTQTEQQLHTNYTT